MFMADQEEARLSLAMMDGWTNFAKYGQVLPNMGKYCQMLASIIKQAHA
jgi:hypothetical protein